MNVRQLEAFKAIMELGSFTRAAEKLHLTQPAVSKLIMLLEHKCGFQLFHRQKNGVIPTAEGEMLYSEVERVFLGLESISARARAIKQFDFGEIDLAVFPSLGTRVLPLILASFLEKKQIKLNLTSRNSWLLVDRVATQGIDVGFGMARTERPGVQFSHLCSMQAVCVLPPWHPLAEKDTIFVRDLENEKFISLAEEDGVQVAIDRAFSEYGVKRNIVLKSQLSESICSFVSAGLGVAIVDPISAVGFTRAELIVKPFLPVIKQDIWVITPSFREVSLGTQALIKHVRTALPAKINELTEAMAPASRP
ncbi:LysR family transcriptional regulator [Falsochrobactrum shanghaiense]|uniref:LysR family transcriptional regulator n=1 Tax=Falsochrobactrum shanghaiense TaxID=2201899 RepID=A0A316JM28_9HYPH|nr:LysR substrate-binding domain-containing protein [Falsochrobactrum shanghaiense]PWL16250.1 LysR family transcriptional regulator [Falsochrobactrum shanghaiense]